MILRRILAVWLITIAGLTGAYAMDTQATAALVIDQNTGTVLLSKNADTPIPPASMSKLMTLYMLFEALRDQRVSLETKFIVSDKSSKMGGSKMFLRPNEQVSVENLIRGIIVQSGNDACIAVAENLAGTEEEFARQMTVRAKQLGLTNSSFGNATGWPHPMQRMSAEDLVLLANLLITEFPEYYGYFSEESFTWDNIKQKNRNPLLTLGIGADGLKTGHTNEAGYGLVGSAVRGQRRIIFMVTGLDSSAARAQEAGRLAGWAFQEFANVGLFDANQTIAQADVWLGKQKAVGLLSPNAITALAPFGAKDQGSFTVRYQGPIEAPIAKGDQIAELVVTYPGLTPTTYPLFAANTVPHGGLFARLKTSAKLLCYEILGAPADAGQ